MIALSAGLASAVCYISVRSGLQGALVLTYLAPVPLLAAGLSSGFAAAAMAAVVASVALLAGVGLKVVGFYLVVTAIPALLIARHALKARTDETTGTTEWYPVGDILGWLTLYGLFLLAGVTIYFSGAPGGLEGSVRTSLRGFFDQIQVGGTGRFPFPIDEIARYFTGMVLSVWLLITLVDTVLAQNLLARAGKSLRPTPAYSQIELPRWLEFAFLIAIIAAFLPGTLGMLGRNASPLLSTPFFLLGLAVIHTLSRRIAARGAVLVALYFLLALVSWLSAVVVLVGLVEQWTSLRQRFSAQGNGTQENE